MEWWEIEPSSCDAALLKAENFRTTACPDVVDRLKPGANVVLTGTFDAVTAFAWACGDLENAGLELRDCGCALTPEGMSGFLLARKPLDGTVAANILAHGTGALNIGASRIGFNDGEVNFERQQRQQNSDGAVEGAFGAAALVGTEIPTYKPEGRWPANLLLEHAEGCQSAGPEVVKSAGYYPSQRGEPQVTNFGAGQPDPNGARTSGNGDGTETIESWNCVEGCPVKTLDTQSGIRAAGRAPETNNVGFGGVYTEGTERAGWKRDQAVNFGSGGASRFFHADQTPKERLEYLIRLIIPKGGTLLDLTGDAESSYCEVIQPAR